MQTEPIELRVDIQRSPDEVFAYIRDYRNAPQWQPDALEIEADSPGPANVGTKVAMKRKTPMGAQSFTVEIIELDEVARTMRDRAQDGMFQGTTVDFAVDDVDGNSRLRIKMVPDMNGIAATLGRIGFVRSRMVKSITDTWSSNLARLASQLKAS